MNVSVEAIDMAPASSPVAIHLDPDISLGFAAIRSFAYATPTYMPCQSTRLSVVINDLESRTDWLSTHPWHANTEEGFDEGATLASIFEEHIDDDGQWSTHEVPILAEPRAKRRRSFRGMLKKTVEHLSTDRSRRIAGVIAATAGIAIYGTMTRHGFTGIHEQAIDRHSVAAFVSRATHIGEAVLGSIGFLGSATAIGIISREKKERVPQPGTVGLYELLGIESLAP